MFWTDSRLWPFLNVVVCPVVFAAFAAARGFSPIWGVVIGLAYGIRMHLWLRWWPLHVPILSLVSSVVIGGITWFFAGPIAGSIVTLALNVAGSTIIVCILAFAGAFAPLDTTIRP